MVAMATKEDLLEELEGMPPFLLEDVLRFVRFLKTHRRGQEIEPTLISESSLAKDWLGPEEDDAWAHL